MKIYGSENNTCVLKEIGYRIKRTRIAMRMTQAELAAKSGLSLSTVARIEHGESVQFEYILSVLRTFRMLGNIDILVPEQDDLPTPMEVITYKNAHTKQRVRHTSKPAKRTSWTWGE